MSSSLTAGIGYRGNGANSAPAAVIVEIFGEIDKAMADRIVRQLAGIRPTDRIDVRINSHGGATREAVDIASRIRLHRGATTGLVTGMCDSAAIVALAACKRRFANAARTFQTHEASVWEMPNLAGRQIARTLRAEADRLAKIDAAICEFVSARIGCSVAEWAEIERREAKLTAREALEINLLTGVIDHPEWTRERDARRQARKETAAIQAGVQADIARSRRPLSRDDRSLLLNWGHRQGSAPRVIGMAPAALLRMLEEKQ